MMFTYLTFNNLFYKICKFRSLKYRFNINNNYMGSQSTIRFGDVVYPHRVSLFHLLETNLERLFVNYCLRNIPLWKRLISLYFRREPRTQMSFHIHTLDPPTLLIHLQKYILLNVKYKKVNSTNQYFST